MSSVRSSSEPGEFSLLVGAATPCDAGAHRVPASDPQTQEDDVAPLVELPDPASELRTAASHRVSGGTAELPVPVPVPVAVPVPVPVAAATPGDSTYDMLASTVDPKDTAALAEDTATASPHDSNKCVVYAPNCDYYFTFRSAALPLPHPDAAVPEVGVASLAPLPENPGTDTERRRLLCDSKEGLPASHNLSIIDMDSDAALSKATSNAVAELCGTGGLSPPRPRTIQQSHVFVCYGSVETWPTTGPIVAKDSLPGLLAYALKSRDMTDKITLSLFDPGDTLEFVQGDVLVFPQMCCYRDLDRIELDLFVDTVLVRGAVWNGEYKAMTGSYSFVCCHDHGDHLKQCSVCGPVILYYLTREIQTQGLQDRLKCYACTAVDETPGDMIFILADAICVNYSEVFPGDVRRILSNLFGDGTLQMNTGPGFRDFWNNLLRILHVGARVRTWIVALAFQMNMDFQRMEAVREMTLDDELEFQMLADFQLDTDRMKAVREAMLNAEVQLLAHTTMMLRAAATACQQWELPFDWREAGRRELYLVVKSIYRSARSVRKAVMAKASLSVISPTRIERQLLVAADHINTLVSYGENLSFISISELGGQPFPKGSGLLLPICGIRIRE